MSYIKVMVIKVDPHSLNSDRIIGQIRNTIPSNNHWNKDNYNIDVSDLGFANGDGGYWVRKEYCRLIADEEIY